MSLKISPFTSNVLAKKIYLVHYILLMWISLIPPILEFWWYWNFFLTVNQILIFVFLPLELYVVYLILVFSSMLFAKIMLIFINLIHKPKEGVFKRDPKNKDYAYWSLRNTIKKWPAWISHTFPIPWHDIILMKLFGTKTNFSNIFFDGWLNCEFVELGKNVSIGQGAVVSSSMIIGNYLIIKKIVLEDNTMVGTHSVLSPGSIMRKNSILSGYSSTNVGQELEEGWIYLGLPAKKYRENIFFDENIKIMFDNPLEDFDKWDKLMDKRKIRIKEE